jgi:hypothetical protein
MDFYDINCLGKIRIERLSSLPAWNTDDEGRIVYLSSTEELFFGDGNAWVIIDPSVAYTKAEADARFLRKDSPGVVEDVYGCKTFCSGLITNNLSSCYSSTGDAVHICQSNTTTGQGLYIRTNACCSPAVVIKKSGGVGECELIRICGCTPYAVPVLRVRNYSNVVNSIGMDVYNCCGSSIWSTSHYSQAVIGISCGTQAAIHAQNCDGTGPGLHAFANNSSLCSTAYCCRALVVCGICGYGIVSHAPTIAIHGRSTVGVAIIGCTCSNSGGIYGVTTCQCATVGVATVSRPVAGNGAYYSFSSRHIKHLCNVCVTECLRKRPLKIYKYTHDDSNMIGFDEFIGPTAEDFHKTFELDHDDFGNDYLGLSGVDGTALALSIENMDKIDILKVVLKRVLKRLKKLEEK